MTPRTEFQLAQGGRFARRFGELPVISHSQRVFEWTIFVGQTMRFKGIKNMTKDPQAMLELASVTRRQGGQMFMPGMTERQIKWMSRTWFAPQFFAGLTSAVSQPLELAARALKGEPTRPPLRESLHSLSTALR